MYGNVYDLYGVTRFSDVIGTVSGRDKRCTLLSGAGGYNEHDIKEDATWQKCTSIDWTEVASEPTMDGKLQLPALQRTDFVGNRFSWKNRNKI